MISGLPQEAQDVPKVVRTRLRTPPYLQLHLCSDITIRHSTNITRTRRTCSRASYTAPSGTKARSNPVMSGPKKAPQNDRVRENQRRSRARKAELLQDLQNRVRDYERQGVAATEEMQRAARVVAQENVRLRELLALKGVTQREVEEYLRTHKSLPEQSMRSLPVSPQNHGHVLMTSRAAVTNSRPTPQPVQWHNATESSTSHPSASTRALIEIPKPTSRACCPAPPLTLNSPSPPKEHSYSSHRTGSAEKVGSGSTKVPDDCPNSLSCYCPPVPEANTPTSSGLEISCETAASIIADMRGDGDRAAARAALGCTGPGECTVRSSTVMQLMDDP